MNQACAQPTRAGLVQGAPTFSRHSRLAANKTIRDGNDETAGTDQYSTGADSADSPSIPTGSPGPPPTHYPQIPA